LELRDSGIEKQFTDHGPLLTAPSFPPHPVPLPLRGEGTQGWPCGGIATRFAAVHSLRYVLSRLEAAPTYTRPSPEACSSCFRGTNEYRTSNFEPRISILSVLLRLKACFIGGSEESEILFSERRSEAISAFNIGCSMFDVRRSKKPFADQDLQSLNPSPIVRPQPSALR
jgi:hypothetical protein